MTRFVFTFGTLYEPDIIRALLGTEPPSFLSVIHGFGVFKGAVDDLSSEIKADISSKRDITNFSFLFAKKLNDPNKTIQGKVYEITNQQELFLDWWERYPKWYRKEVVTLTNDNGKTYEAFVYVIDKGRTPMDTFDRVQGEIVTYIESAKKLRQKVLNEFPNIKS